MNSEENTASGQTAGQGEHLAPADETTTDTKEAAPDICPECQGSGRKDGEPCPACDGTGQIEEAVGGG